MVVDIGVFGGRGVICVGTLVEGRSGHAEEGEGGLEVDYAFPEEGEAIIEATAAMVEGFVGQREPLLCRLVSVVVFKCGHLLP